MTARNKVLLAWGAMDAFYVVWYSYKAFQAGRIPYLTDLSNTFALGADIGRFNITMVTMSWLLQFSIILSAVLFLCRYRRARYLGFAQIPLRLLFIYPSISLILVFGSQLKSMPLTVILLVLGSETIKGWSLWKYT